jgi:hypothetical protein
MFGGFASGLRGGSKPSGLSSAGGTAALLFRLQTLFESVHFGIQSLREVGTEFSEVLFDQRHLSPPAFEVDT